MESTNQPLTADLFFSDSWEPSASQLAENNPANYVTLKVSHQNQAMLQPRRHPRYLLLLPFDHSYSSSKGDLVPY